MQKIFPVEKINDKLRHLFIFIYLTLNFKKCPLCTKEIYSWYAIKLLKKKNDNYFTLMYIDNCR